jgi:adenine-specific DNA-methyltransferase
LHIYTGTKIELNGKEVILFKKGEYDEIKTVSSVNNFKKISIRGSLREGNSSGRYYTPHTIKSD